MKLLDSLRIVWRNLWRMKLRTILTSVGVMIGTAAIVAMMSLSIGLKENAVKSLESWGNLTEMEVYPAYWYPDGRGEIPYDQRKELNWAAVQELKQVPGVSAVMPTKRVYMPVEVTYGRLKGHIEIVGVDVREAAVFKGNDVAKGEFLSGSNNEILISSNVAQYMRDEEKEKREQRQRERENRNSGGGMQQDYYYYGGMPSEGNSLVDLVGQTVTLVFTRQTYINDEMKVERKEIRARVVGQLEQSDDWRYNNVAFVPMDIVNEINSWAYPDMGNNGGGSPIRRDRSATVDHTPIVFDNITIKVESRDKVEQAVEQVMAQGYEIYSPARALQEINQFFFVVQLVLGGIAAISLLVATIGIINTMIMSILERTREIGIMKVIGATVYNIRWLFLVESGTIGLIGGLTGLGMAAGAVSLINYIARLNPEFNLFGGSEPVEAIAVIPLWLALFAITFSVIIGLIAGLYPAFRASRLSPLQAIRSE